MGWNEINEATDRAHRRDLEIRDAETRGRFREVELQHAHVERLAKLRCENAEQLESLARAEWLRDEVKAEAWWTRAKGVALVLFAASVLAMAIGGVVALT